MWMFVCKDWNLKPVSLNIKVHLAALHFEISYLENKTTTMKLSNNNGKHYEIIS